MPDFALFTTYVREMFVSLFPIIASEEWTAQAVTAEDGSVTGWTDQERKDFNKFMHLLNNVYNDKFRRAYDATIWVGHKTGKVATTLEPVRKETVRKDATDKVAPSAEDLFDSLA